MIVPGTDDATHNACLKLFAETEGLKSNDYLFVSQLCSAHTTSVSRFRKHCYCSLRDSYCSKGLLDLHFVVSKRSKVYLKGRYRKLGAAFREVPIIAAELPDWDLNQDKQ